MSEDTGETTRATATQGSTSNSSAAWAVVAGLAVVAATFLIFVYLTNSEDPAQSPLRGEESPATSSTTVAPATTADDDPQAADDTAQQSAAQGLTAEQEAFLLDLQRRDADDVMALGDVDAPVVLIEYSDFRCPFCAQWATEVKPELQSYLDDGTLRIEYHDVALLGPESVNAAVGARAAGEQGKYWEFHDALFAETAAGDHPDMPADKLIELATEVGIPDLEMFEERLGSADLIKAVEDETASARELGISSTPTFIVNTAIVQGAQPTDVFTATVKSEAAKATG